MEPIRIVMVDDSPLFLETAAGFLRIYPNLAVVGCFTSAVAALEHYEELNPDLMLIDLAMPELNGLELTAFLKSGPRPPAVIILTMYDLPRYLSATLHAGADGYVKKEQFALAIMNQLVQLFPELAREDEQHSISNAA